MLHTLLVLGLITQSLTFQAQTPACVYNGVLPDSNCTPGQIDLNITQENIHQTICVPGYTDTVRPGTSYTTPLKLRQMALYGDTDANGVLLSSSIFEEDHLIPLELGGAPRNPYGSDTGGNLWPERGASPNQKDQVENAAHTAVCNGDIDLEHTQWLIATDWRALGVLLGVIKIQ